MTILLVYLFYAAVLFWGPWTRPRSFLSPNSSARYGLGVVFTGGEKRIETAIDLLESGVIDTLIVSSATERKMAGIEKKYWGGKPIPHVLEPNATSTHGNAFFTGVLIKEHEKRIVVLITNDYHMNRAYRLLWLALRHENVEIICCPVQKYPDISESMRMKIGSIRKLRYSERIKMMLNFTKFVYNGTRISGNNKWEDDIELLLDNTVFTRLLRL